MPVAVRVVTRGHRVPLLAQLLLLATTAAAAAQTWRMLRMDL
jgi:hypothetical protein